MKLINQHKQPFTWTQFLNGMPAHDYVFQDISYVKQISHAADMIDTADAILIGAGAGLSTAAGLQYGGKRFTDNFEEFIDKYGSMNMRDMYSAGFYPFETEEAKWGYWSKHSFLNCIEPEGLPLYKMIYDIVKAKAHFVITTNVDHQFWKAGFKDKDIFATQGDYGLIQCEKGCHQKTYDAIDMFKQMNQTRKECLVPSYMVPKCPVCGGNMAMHLRCDQHFVEDEHWQEAMERYGEFLTCMADKKVVLLELGVGFNTPTIIRFPFERLVREHKDCTLIRLNLEEAVVPKSFGDRAVGINEDIQKVIKDITDCQNHMG